MKNNEVRGMCAQWVWCGVCGSAWLVWCAKCAKCVLNDVCVCWCVQCVSGVVCCSSRETEVHARVLLHSGISVSCFLFCKIDW